MVVLVAPLSFWGGFNLHTGELSDPHHPQAGESLAGKILLMPSGRGSSSSSSVLAEAIRVGTAPIAILLLETDPIVVLGALVARELYGSIVPVGVLSPESYGRLSTGKSVTVSVGKEGVLIS